MKRTPPLETSILTLRRQKVILDADLALLYGVSTKVLNQSIKRNVDRFPDDFVFQITPKELGGLRSQIVTTKAQAADMEYDGALKSQIVPQNKEGAEVFPMPLRNMALSWPPIS